MESQRDVINHRFNNRFAKKNVVEHSNPTGGVRRVGEKNVNANVDLVKNRWATWDMYLGKPQTQHPMYDISELTKSKKDVIYTIKKDFIKKDEVQYALKDYIDDIESLENGLVGETFNQSVRRTAQNITKKGDSWIVPDTDVGYFGTMGGFHWKIEKMPDGNYKAIANDVWDLQPLKNQEIGKYNTLSGKILNKVIKPIKNIEVGKALGIGKPLNVKVGFILDGKTKKIINTFGLAPVIGSGVALGATQYKQGGTTNDYIELDLTPEEIQKYIDGGYVVEEIDNYQDGGDNQSNGETYKYLGRPDSLYKKSLNGRWSISNKSTGNKFVSIEDPKGSRTTELDKNAVTVSSLNKKRRDHLSKLHKEIAFPKEFVDLNDTRTVRATTGEKINPNVDLKGDKYNKAIIDNIIKKSKAVGVDPSTMLAIALQETNFGKTDPNLGHVKKGYKGYPYSYIDFYKQKLNEVKFKDELLQIQYYNGLGTVYPETEEDYHGYEMQKIYGVPLPASGINMRKNPLYGKQIIDLRDNVVLKNPYIQKTLKEKKQGGTTNDYVDVELTTKEVKDLIAQGYVLEALN
jgi:hypothetical protein